MTNRAGYYETGTTDTTLNFSTEFTHRGGDDGFIVLNSGATQAQILYFKNQGYYVSGAVFEEWVTTSAPQTLPPSGHTLADTQYQVLET